jgi:transcriptional regulator with XRE-family HTH domain
MARELGTSQPTVSRILNGQPNCLGSTLDAIRKLHAATFPYPLIPGRPIDGALVRETTGKTRRVGDRKSLTD